MRDLMQDFKMLNSIEAGLSRSEREEAFPDEEALQHSEGIWSSIYDIKLAVSEISRDADEAMRAHVKRRVREMVRHNVPRRARMAVRSGGDSDWLDLYGRRTEHFPQTGDGLHLYPCPDIDMALIANLESLRAREIDYLLIPEPGRSWMESCSGFGSHLQTFYPVVVSEEGAGIVFDLQVRRKSTELPWWRQIGELLEEQRASSGRAPSILDWRTGLGLRRRFPDCSVVWAEDDLPPLPYADSTIDFVVLDRSDLDLLTEARRIASVAVIMVGAGDTNQNGSGPDSGGATVSIHRLGYTRSTLPSVSVVIPTFNGLSYLIPCLHALEETLPSGFEGQVIVVDDASTDDTASVIRELARQWKWLRLVRNSENQGFVASCNVGARAAVTEFLVFLNNDTVPLMNWLPPLLRTFLDWPDVGAVGGKLLYPHGRLQEAGCVLFSDGSGANFGRGAERIDAPLFNYVRRVTYCSGALLATPKALFLDVGGFDGRYRPAYYEDADYCMALSERGYGVFYQPESVVVHIEGASSGTDLRNGIKRYQAINQDKFVEKWRHALVGRPTPPARYDSRAWHELAHLY